MAARLAWVLAGCAAVGAIIIVLAALAALVRRRPLPPILRTAVRAALRVMLPGLVAGAIHAGLGGRFWALTGPAVTAAVFLAYAAHFGRESRRLRARLLALVRERAAAQPDVIVEACRRAGDPVVRAAAVDALRAAGHTAHADSLRDPPVQ